MEMIELNIVYSDDSNYDRLMQSNINNILINAYDIKTHTGKSKGNKLRYNWGANKLPFVILTDGDKPLKTFYSDSPYEPDNDVINQVINYLNEKS